MTDDVSVQYLRAARAALDAIEAEELGPIRRAADRFARAIAADRLVHVFGTGHSRMAVEEMFPRYGSFPGFHPIVELSMTFHNPVVGANGQRQAMFLENVQGFGPVLWKNFVTSPDDCLLAISTSGCKRGDGGRGDRGAKARNVRGRPHLDGPLGRLHVEAPDRSKTPTRSPTSSSISARRRAIRRSGSRGSHRPSHPFQAFPAAL